VGRLHRQAGEARADGEELRPELPLLADPEGKVADSYGVRSLMGTARRSVFLIDRQGIVRYRHEDPLSLSYRSVDDILQALEQSGLVEKTG